MVCLSFALWVGKFVLLGLGCGDCVVCGGGSGFWGAFVVLISLVSRWFVGLDSVGVWILDLWRLDCGFGLLMFAV